MRVFALLSLAVWLFSCKKEGASHDANPTLYAARRSGEQAATRMVPATDLPVKIGVPFQDRKSEYYSLLADKGKFSWIEEKIGAVLISTRIRPSIQGRFSSVPALVTEEISSTCHKKHGQNIQGAIGCIGAHVNAWEIASQFKWGDIGNGENLRTYCLTYARAILITFEEYLNKDRTLLSHYKIGYENTPFHILNTISIENKNGRWYRYAFDVGFDYYNGAVVLYPDNSETVNFHYGEGASTTRMASMIKPDTEISP